MRWLRLTLLGLLAVSPLGCAIQRPAQQDPETIEAVSAARAIMERYPASYVESVEWNADGSATFKICWDSYETSDSLVGPPSLPCQAGLWVVARREGERWRVESPWMFEEVLGCAKLEPRFGGFATLETVTVQRWLPCGDTLIPDIEDPLAVAGLGD